MMNNKQEAPSNSKMCYTHATTWMNPENAVQRARSQSQKATNRMSPFSVKGKGEESIENGR